MKRAFKVEKINGEDYFLLLINDDLLIIDKGYDVSPNWIRHHIVNINLSIETLARILPSVVGLNIKVWRLHKKDYAWYPIGEMLPLSIQTGVLNILWKAAL